MMQRALVKPLKSTHKKKVVGRGSGCKKGGTSGRGHKGYKSRAGSSKRHGFEGGQMPLIRKLPKVGFTNYPFKKIFQIIQIGNINIKFNEGEEINIESLKKKRLISSKRKRIKIVGGGTFDKKLVFSPLIQVTKSVKKQINDSGSSFKK
jgi:large subunit ribosomal protein L15